MEKRFYLGIGLLVACLLLGWLSVWAMEKTHQPVIQLLEQAALVSQQGDLQTAADLGMQAKNQWLRSWSVSTALTDHDPLDQIEALFAQMDYYAAVGQQHAFGSCCVRLSALVQAVEDDHRLTLWNLL